VIAKLVLIFALLIAMPVGLFYVLWCRGSRSPVRRHEDWCDCLDGLHYTGFRKEGRR